MRADAARGAVAVLTTNHRHSTGYDFTCPSPENYPFQWAWDSSFHAIALTHVDPERARAEIDSLLRGLDDAGFLPHMLLWQEDLRERATADFRIALWDGWKSVTLAPPVLARAIERVHAATGEDAWLTRVAPLAARFFDWLHRTRAGRDGLLTIYQPDESGLDVSPKYDEALGIAGSGPQVADRWHAAMRTLLDGYAPGRRPDSRFARFQWIDLVFNSVYADGLRCLARIGERTGAIDGDRYRRRYLDVGTALVRRCWDPDAGLFRDVDLVTGVPSGVLTSGCLFPIILDVVPNALADRVIDEHLLDPRKFWLPYPVPSVAACEPSFDPDFRTGAIFRGSTWVNLNWYLYWGLRERGRTRVATVLAERTVAMVARGGLRECYGPYDGAGHGATSFGWSTLVLDLIAAEEVA